MEDEVVIICVYNLQKITLLSHYTHDPIATAASAMYQSVHVRPCKWVTISESLLLYVFAFMSYHQALCA